MGNLVSSLRAATLGGDFWRCNRVRKSLLIDTSCEATLKLGFFLCELLVGLSDAAEFGRGCS